MLRQLTVDVGLSRLLELGRAPGYLSWNRSNCRLLYRLPNPLNQAAHNSKETHTLWRPNIILLLLTTTISYFSVRTGRLNGTLCILLGNSLMQINLSSKLNHPWIFGKVKRIQNYSGRQCACILVGGWEAGPYLGPGSHFPSKPLSLDLWKSGENSQLSLLLVVRSWQCACW